MGEEEEFSLCLTWEKCSFLGSQRRGKGLEGGAGEPHQTISVEVRDSEDISAGPCSLPALPAGSTLACRSASWPPASAFLSGLKGVTPVPYCQVSLVGNGRNKMKTGRLTRQVGVEHLTSMPWGAALTSRLGESVWWCRGRLAQHFGDRSRLIFVSSRPNWSIERVSGQPEPKNKKPKTKRWLIPTVPAIRRQRQEDWLWTGAQPGPHSGCQAS